MAWQPAYGAGAGSTTEENHRLGQSSGDQPKYYLPWDATSYSGIRDSAHEPTKPISNKILIRRLVSGRKEAEGWDVAEQQTDPYNMVGSEGREVNKSRDATSLPYQTGMSWMGNSSAGNMDHIVEARHSEASKGGNKMQRGSRADSQTAEAPFVSELGYPSARVPRPAGEDLYPNPAVLQRVFAGVLNRLHTDHPDQARLQGGALITRLAADRLFLPGSPAAGRCVLGDYRLEPAKEQGLSGLDMTLSRNPWLQSDHGGLGLRNWGTTLVLASPLQTLDILNDKVEKEKESLRVRLHEVLKKRQDVMLKTAPADFLTVRAHLLDSDAQPESQTIKSFNEKHTQTEDCQQAAKQVDETKDGARSEGLSKSKPAKTQNKAKRPVSAVTTRFAQSLNSSPSSRSTNFRAIGEVRNPKHNKSRQAKLEGEKADERRGTTKQSEWEAGTKPREIRDKSSGEENFNGLRARRQLIIAGNTGDVEHSTNSRRPPSAGTKRQKLALHKNLSPRVETAPGQASKWHKAAEKPKPTLELYKSLKRNVPKHMLIALKRHSEHTTESMSTAAEGRELPSRVTKLSQKTPKSVEISKVRAGDQRRHIEYQTPASVIKAEKRSEAVKTPQSVPKCKDPLQTEFAGPGSRADTIRANRVHLAQPTEGTASSKDAKAPSIKPSLKSALPSRKVGDSLHRSFGNKTDSRFSTPATGALSAKGACSNTDWRNEYALRDAFKPKLVRKKGLTARPMFITGTTTNLTTKSIGISSFGQSDWTGQHGMMAGVKGGIGTHHCTWDEAANKSQTPTASKEQADRQLLDSKEKKTGTGRDVGRILSRISGREGRLMQLRREPVN